VVGIERHEMSADGRVVALARRADGVVTSAQLAEAGLSPTAIAHRVGSGWLVRLHRGVFLVGPLEAPRSRAKAAVLAAGEGAVLSHLAAATLWEFLAARPGAIDVTLPGRNARTRPGVRLHRVSRLHPADVTRRHDLPVTSPGRTLLDLATRLTPHHLARAINEAQVQRRLTPHSLNEQFQRYPNHRGTAALRDATTTDPAFTRSEAERRLLDLIRAARLPQPRTNIRVRGHEVDFLWSAQRLIVEVDGYAFHSTRAAFERDRIRDADLIAAGDRVIRVTWRRLTREPGAVVAMLAVALAG
jgi:very-short-patch-repair endonuclease